MHIVISAPTGFNTREILLPLKSYIDKDETITHVSILTPAAPYQQDIFQGFSKKFSFHKNPPSEKLHQEFFKKERPNIVVTPTIGLDPNDTPIITAAKSLHIPTLTFIASWDNVFKIERMIKHGISGNTTNTKTPYAIPDHFAVWNQMNKDHLLKIFPDTVAPEHITITGAPRFDYFSHTPRIPNKRELYEYLGIPYDSSHQLLHCATTELYPFDYIIKIIDTARQRHALEKMVDIYASVHPGGNIERHRYDKMWKATVRYSFGRRDNSPLPEFAYLPSEFETYMLIALFKHSNILINQSSTVAIESMCADVPVINILFGKRFDWWRWYRSMVYRDFRQHYRYITDESGTTLVRTKHQLIEAINTYIQNPEHKARERKQTVKKLLTHTDGLSSHRLLALIKKIGHVDSLAT